MSNIGFNESDFYIVFFILSSALILAFGVLYIFIDTQSRRELELFRQQLRSFRLESTQNSKALSDPPIAKREGDFE